MINKKSGLGLMLVAALGMSATAGSKELTSLLAPYDEWYFSFAYPKALPAVVTYAEVLDTDGIFYQFRALDGAAPSSQSVGGWAERGLGVGVPDFDKAKNPPQFIHFCWDSVIDKKVYETRITFSGEVWKMMLTPYPSVLDASKKSYHRFMLIGLAPEGKVRVWLENDNKPNIPLTHDKNILVETVSGAQLKMCKGVTAFSRGYKYIQETTDFIKGKKYPYGEW